MQKENIRAMKHIENDIENIYFNKAECGVDFLINTDIGCCLKNYYYGGKVYATDFFEILFFREAGGSVWIDDRHFEIAPNSVLFLSPYQRHSFNITASCDTFCFLIFREDFLLDFLADKYFTYRLHYSYQTSVPPVMTVSETQMRRYFDTLEEIGDELHRPLTNVEPILRSLLYYLLSKLNRTYAETYSLPSVRLDNTVAYRFKEMIEKNIVGKQRVCDYAEALGVSRITLNKAVKAQFGMTATDMLRQRLVNEIKNHIIRSQCTAKAIADRFGFSEPNHLMRFFKAQTGQTIGDYLQEYALDKTPQQDNDPTDR